MTEPGSKPAGFDWRQECPQHPRKRSLFRNCSEGRLSALSSHCRFRPSADLLDVVSCCAATSCKVTFAFRAVFFKRQWPLCGKKAAVAWRRRLRHDRQMSAADTYHITNLLKRDHIRWHALGLVEALDLPQGCIGAGFVRNLVWDNFHGDARDCRKEDLDVLFYDKSIIDAAYDAEIEAILRENAPDLSWSVRNQARMHLRNNDVAYTSVEDAMRFWPETATAVAAMRSGNDCIIIAPFGLSDLDRLILRPTSAVPHKITSFHARIEAKNWRTKWPRVKVLSKTDEV